VLEFSWENPEAIKISVCHKVQLEFITECEISLSASPHYSFCPRTYRTKGCEIILLCCPLNRELILSLREARKK
jgi:hypothetical protein